MKDSKYFDNKAESIETTLWLWGIIISSDVSLRQSRDRCSRHFDIQRKKIDGSVIISLFHLSKSDNCVLAW